MSDEAPRAPEGAPRSREKPQPAEQGRGLAGIIVLVVAALGAIAIAWLPSLNLAPRRAVPGDTASTSATVSTPAVPATDPDLAAAVAVDRAHGASPFDAATTDSAVASCVAAVREGVPTSDSVVVDASFGDVDPTKGRADSLIVEGRVGERSVWHCASTRRSDGAVGERAVTVERAWSGLVPSFPGNHALTMAAVESCLRRAKRIFREHEFRGVRREQRGESLEVSGDAVPLENDLVRQFSCTATIGAGRVVAATAREVK